MPVHFHTPSHSSLAAPGRLVSLRGREWVVLPSDDAETLLLKPLGGSDEEITGIHLPLGFKDDEPREAGFPAPNKQDLGAFSSARLLLESARLAFRNGAGPFRRLAKLSFRPRAYQMVPLIMALRHEPVRLTQSGNKDTRIEGIITQWDAGRYSNPLGPIRQKAIE